MSKKRPIPQASPAPTETSANPPESAPPAGHRPARSALFRSIDWWCFGITTFIVLAGYLWTLAPNLTLEDCGELAVGSYYAGVPHPPGYPVWTIYSWLFTVLLPISNIAWRVAVSSAVAGAFSAGLLALMVSRGSSMMIEGIPEFRGLARGWENRICLVAGFVSGMMFGFNGFMWSQSVIVEVYTFSVLSFVGVLVCLMRWLYEPRQRRYLYLAFFLFGICFTNHQTLIVAAMGLEVLIAMVRPRLGRDLFLANSILFILGLLAKSQGMLTAFNDNQSLFAIYLFVGVASLITWIWLAIETMAYHDWKILLIDALFFFSLCYLILLIFTAGGVRPEIHTGLVHFLGLAAFGGFLYFTWPAVHSPAEARRVLIRGSLASLVFLYLVVLIYSSGGRETWLSRQVATFLWINLIGLAVAGVLVYRVWRASEFGKVVFPLFSIAGLWLSGAAFYLYMPIASMTNPPMNWGYPRMVGGFIHALTRGQYEKTQPTDSVIRFLDQLFNLFVEGAMEEFTLVFLCVALIPFFFFRKMQKRERSWVVGLSAIFLCLSVLLLMLLNPNTDQQSKDLTKVFFTASHLVIAMGIGYGLTLVAAMLATQFENYRYFLLIGAFTACGVALFEMAAKLENIQYDLIRFAYIFVLFLAVAFTALVLAAGKPELRQSIRIPTLSVALVLFASTPVFSISAHWADNEQRGHLFGYWFGHDMFTPPFDLYPEMAGNAILFGGTDPGRFCPTYMIFCESFIPPSKKRDPDFDRRDVYIITQNALADGTYLQYIRAHYNRSQQIDDPFFQELFRSAREKRLEELERDPKEDVIAYTNVIARSMIPLDRFFTKFGKKVEERRRANGVYPAKEIHIPTPEETGKCYERYYADAFRRMQMKQLRPGEVVVPTEDGQISISGQTAVMTINGYLTEIIFQKNPEHEFYLEESYPLDWMKPHLSPFGIIMKINREPLEELTPEIVTKDHLFWRKYSERLIGDWITYDTPIEKIADFVVKVYGRKDHENFPGDPKFARDKMAQKSFSKLRSSIAGLYNWRRQNAKSDEERDRMLKEADFAYRQAFAFYPGSPEAVANYAQMLASVGRVKDAILVARTALKIDPHNLMVPGLLQQLFQFQEAQPQVEQARSELGQLEQEFATNPLNMDNTIKLVSAYYQLNESNKALNVLDQVLSLTNAGPDVILQLASAFQQLNDLPRLRQTLQRLVVAMPENPEAWYDLAAIQAAMGEAKPALQALTRALELNDERLRENPAASDLREVLKDDTRFMGLRELPAYDAAVQPK